MKRLITDMPVVRALAGWCGSLCLKALGWRIQGAPPKHSAYIVVVAPHTSRWDSIVTASAFFAQRLPVYWLAKHSLFRKPFGGVLRAFGGIPVDRDRGAHALAEAERLLEDYPRPLVIFPEGTRALQPRWKSGFLRLAGSEALPVVPVALDFPQKVFYWGPVIQIRDVPDVMARLRDFYEGVNGRNPDRVSPIRVAEEDASKGARD